MARRQPETMIEAADIRQPETVASSEVKCHSLQRLVRGHLSATLINGDCLDALPIEAAAVISDPQYQLANGKKANVMGTSTNRGKAGRESKGKIINGRDWGIFEGDDAPYDPTPWLEYPTVILWGAIHYANRLPNSTSWLMWDKREGVAADDNADCEMAWSNIGGPARIHRQLWKGLCRRGEENASIQGEKLHPFQKPVALMGWCIRLAKLPPGSVILDPYMGSGTTGIAALRMGMNFVGVEKDPEHFLTACARLEAECNQGALL